MKFKPLHDNVLVRRTEVKKQTEGGIILPDKALEKMKEGTVEAVAEGMELVSVGDRILFTAYAGTEIKLNEEEFLVMAIEDVLGVLKDD